MRINKILNEVIKECIYAIENMFTKRKQRERKSARASERESSTCNHGLPKDVRGQSVLAGRGTGSYTWRMVASFHSCERGYTRRAAPWGTARGIKQR